MNRKQKYHLLRECIKLDAATIQLINEIEHHRQHALYKCDDEDYSQVFGIDYTYDDISEIEYE